MRKLSKAKWLTASGGLFCLATILALSLHLPANPAQQRTVAASHASSRLFQTATLSAAQAAPTSKVNIVKHYGELPLAFEPAESSASPAKYLARGNGYALFLAPKEAVLELRSPSKTPAILRMQLAGANPAPRFTPLDQLPGRSNYFIGNNPRNWRTGISQYSRVLESEVYRGVNLVYYGTQGRLEYDFDVAPGADPSAIRLAFQGAEDLRIDAQGELVAHTQAGDVRLRKPVAYQKIAGTQKPVAVSYSLKGDDNVSFELAEYDPRSPLVIDPILIYSTYLGGSNIDTANGIAVAYASDVTGYTAFITGSTFSLDFPTAHPLQSTNNGNPDFPVDAFVARISEDGSSLEYSTYLGGSNRNFGNAIAVDQSGDAFVVGTTLSPDYPVTTGSFDTDCGADGKCGASFNNGLLVSNGFVTELNPAGSALLYSGFIGGDQNATANAIAVDVNGSAYVTGSIGGAVSSTGPILVGNSASFQTLPTGTSTNAYIFKIDRTGTDILYFSYLGGNTEDVGYGVAVDGNANAYLTGLTYSTNFPNSSTTTLSFPSLQTTNAGAGDGFIAKFNTIGSGATSLLFSTYLGGTGLDQGNAIALDGVGNIFVAGQTNSAAFGFAPAGTFQTNYGGQGDAFVVELTTNGSLSYFTYLGGSHADSATGIAVDSSDNAYVTGTTVSIDFPTAGAVFQPAYGGGNTDSFVAKLGPGGTTLLYSSYLGGTNAELATGIAVDTSGSAYVTGQTCSEDFPLANPLQAVPGGNCDAYIAKVSILAGISINPSGLIFAAQSLGTTSQPQTLTITNGDNPQTVNSVTISGANPGDFIVETNNCSSLAVGASCSVTVTFAPLANGVRKASLLITDTAPGSPQVVNLTGNTSTVTLSASSLTFGQQQVGVPSAAQDVTVSNTGTTPLTFTSITASGDFSETDNCVKAPLQPGTNCVIQVVFTPSAAVAEVGSVTLNDSGSGSPQEILTTGTGILEPQALVTPASLGFASTAIGTPSAAQGAVLTNTGDAPLTVSSIVISGANPSDFFQSNTCGSILSPGAGCSIGVIFTPTAAGFRTATLTITDNTGNVTGSTQTVLLSGIGLAVPVVTLSTTSITFPTIGIGTTSAAQTVTLTNTGSAPLLISAVAITGNFIQNNNCPASVAAGASCTIFIAFTPLTSVNQFGTVTITDNAAGSPQTISLSGIGSGASFLVSSLTSTPSVPAGKPATYNVSVTSPNGFSQGVALTCSAPATLTCTIAPSAVTPTAAPSTVAIMTVTTALRTAAPPSPGIKIDPINFLRHFNTTWLMWLAVVLMILTAASFRRRPISAAFGLAVVLLLASVACGGGASGVPAGTPAGTYQITITGTSGTTSVPTTVTLNVS